MRVKKKKQTILQEKGSSFAKLKEAGQPRHKLIQVTGHARESSLDDWDQTTEGEIGVGVGVGVGVGWGWGFPLGLPGTRADATVSGEKGTVFLINKSCKPLNEFGWQEVLAY